MTDIRASMSSLMAEDVDAFDNYPAPESFAQFAVDVVVRAQILELLGDLSSRLKLAYLFVSHDLNLVRAIADRVYVMQKGRIVEHGATAAIFASPQHEYTRALLAATPRIARRLGATAPDETG